MKKELLPEIKEPVKVLCTVLESTEGIRQLQMCFIMCFWFKRCRETAEIGAPLVSFNLQRRPNQKPSVLNIRTNEHVCRLIVIAGSLQQLVNIAL